MILTTCGILWAGPLHGKGGMGAEDLIDAADLKSQDQNEMVFSRAILMTPLRNILSAKLGLALLFLQQVGIYNFGTRLP